MVAKRKPYNDRDDIDKIKSQWRKLSGLHSREEWSAAIVRAATASEIAANFIVRTEFSKNSEFDEMFVNSLLRWANGLAGKIDRLIIPMEQDKKRKTLLNSLKKTSEKISNVRNRIVHQGEFSNEKEAIEIIADSRKFIEALLKPYPLHLNLDNLNS